MSLVAPPHTGLPLPPYKIGNGIHFISGQFKVALGWLVKAYSSHSIHLGGGCLVQAHKAKGLILGIKGVGAHVAKGSVPKMQGDGSTNEPGGGGHVLTRHVGLIT